MNVLPTSIFSAVSVLIWSGTVLAQAPGPVSETLTVADATARALKACNSQVDFNGCIAATVEYLFADRRNRGYADTAFSRNLDYGPEKQAIKASNPPATMCVAAVSEVAIEALNFYYGATKSDRPFKILKAESWNKSRRTDIRSYIWENEGDTKKRGAGHAFASFGLGEMVEFRNARPGDFLSLDRSKFRPRVTWTEQETKDWAGKPLVTFEGQLGRWKASGHSTIFLGYLDKGLNPTLKYPGPDVVGFLYFSSQGSAAPNGGFNYRWAIFRNAKDSNGKGVCETASLSARMDCSLDGVDRGSLRVGRLWNPAKWDEGGPQRVAQALAANVRSSIEKLANLDLKTFKTYPGVSSERLNLPEFKGVFGQSPNVGMMKSFVDTLVQRELDKENDGFDRERLNGVTD